MLRGLSALFLTTVLPRKKRMGSEVASQAVVDVLVELGVKVTVVGYVRTKDDYALDSHELCVSRRHIETKDAGLHPFVWLARSLLKGLPYSIAKYISHGYVSSVRKLLAQNTYDLVILDHVQMSWLLKAVPLKCKQIGMAHNVEHEMYRSFMGNQQSGLRRWIYERESRLIKEMEIAFANSVDQLWVLTKRDAESFSAIKKNGSIKEIPLPAATIATTMTPPLKEYDIGLIGSWTWKANEEGLRWFFDRVYPHLSANVNIHVAGNGAQWLAERYSNVSYVGFVDDVRVFLQQARVIAIPTLSGGGIQIKTLDAIASGSRIVATPLALRGIDDYPSTVTLAEGAEQFLSQLLSAIVSSDTDGASAAEAMRWSLLRQNRFREKVNQGVAMIIQGN